uniref:Uncharacterized protein n=1 Tax=Globodera rostochiensis TaxID=31243 RepID=A0A914I6H3_GLORO
MFMMKFVVPLPPGKAFDCFFRPLFLQLRSSSSRAKARGKGKAKAKRPPKPFVFPAHFAQRLSQWKELLEAESLAMKEKNEQIFDEPLSVVLKNIERLPLSGDHLQFAPMSEDDDLFHIQPNMRVSIWLKEKDSLLKKEALTGIVHTKSDDLVEIRLTNQIASSVQSQSQLRVHSEWFLNPKHTNPFQFMKHLLQNPLEMQKLPGFDTLLYTYGINRNEKMKKIKRDKKLLFLLNRRLNGSQISAVAASINTHRPFVAIHGPPGTGKTRVIAEIVSQQVQKGKNVMVCAPSHKAVDNAMKACEMQGVPSFVRLGEVGDDSVLSQYRLKNLAQKHAEYEHLEKDIELSEELKSRTDYFENNRYMRRVHSILRTMSKRKNIICQSIGKGANVIFCTCTSGQMLQFLAKGWFQPDLVVMDEASQQAECVSWIMLLHAPRFVIVGDHQQLPPFLLSVQNIPSKNTEMSRHSLLEHISDNFKNEDLFHFLSTQYRSNELIQKWSNRMFYDNKLVTNPSTKSIRLRELIKKKQNWLIDDPLVLVDTDRGITDEKWLEIYRFFKLWHPLSFREGQHKHTQSFHNTGEALCAVLHMRALHLFGGLNKHQIGCITPYSAQTEKIQKLLSLEGDDGLNFEVSSVDSFQGQQREAIVMSLVRNNKMHELGFLREYRRTNVAVTRAKRQFFLIGSSSMLNADRMLKELLDVIKTDGRVFGPDALLPVALELYTGHSRKCAYPDATLHPAVSPSI